MQSGYPSTDWKTTRWHIKRPSRLAAACMKLSLETYGFCAETVRFERHYVRARSRYDVQRTFATMNPNVNSAMTAEKPKASW